MAGKKRRPAGGCLDGRCRGRGVCGHVDARTPNVVAPKGQANAATTRCCCSAPSGRSFLAQGAARQGKPWVTDAHLIKAPSGRSWVSESSRPPRRGFEKNQSLSPGLPAWAKNDRPDGTKHYSCPGHPPTIISIVSPDNRGRPQGTGKRRDHMLLLFSPIGAVVFSPGRSPAGQALGNGRTFNQSPIGAFVGLGIFTTAPTGL